MWLFDKKKIVFIVASRCIEFSCFLRRLTPRGTTVIRKRANEILRLLEENSYRARAVLLGKQWMRECHVVLVSTDGLESTVLVFRMVKKIK